MENTSTEAVFNTLICTLKSLPEKGWVEEARKGERKKELSSHLPDLQPHSTVFTICITLHPSAGFPLVLPIWRAKYEEGGGNPTPMNPAH